MSTLHLKYNTSASTYTTTMPYTGVAGAVSVSGDGQALVLGPTTTGSVAVPQVKFNFIVPVLPASATFTGFKFYYVARSPDYPIANTSAAIKIGATTSASLLDDDAIVLAKDYSTIYYGASNVKWSNSFTTTVINANSGAVQVILNLTPDVPNSSTEYSISFDYAELITYYDFVKAAPTITDPKAYLENKKIVKPLPRTLARYQMGTLNSHSRPVTTNPQILPEQTPEKVEVRT